MLAALAVALLFAATPRSAVAGQLAVSAPASTVAPLSVRVKQPTSSILPGGTLSLQVLSHLQHAAAYFEVRVRVYRPSGRLLYQKTEIRNGVAAGTIAVAFSRDLSRVGSRPGRYPVEVRVVASGTRTTTVRSRVLVSDPALKPLPVAVVVRVTSPLALDANGRFAIDPAEHDSERAFVDGLADIANARATSITLAIAPATLEQWQRVAKGYRVLGPAGVRSVTAGSAVPQRYAATLRKLAAAVQAGRIELLNVPYAEPDLGHLQRIRALPDLSRHYTLGVAVYKQVLGTGPSAGSALSDDVIPRDALSDMADSGVGYFVCSSRSAEPSATPGVYTCGTGEPRALVADAGLSAVAVSGSAQDVLDEVFTRALTSPKRPSALTAIVNAGPGEPATLADVTRLFGALDSAPWVECVSAARAAQLTPDGAVALVRTVSAPTGAPADYWRDVAQARRYALALLDARGAHDTAANSTMNAVLTAESRAWVGPDGSYPFAERGETFATSATRYAKNIFDGIRVQMRDVTLAGRSGDVPVTVSSSTDKALTVHVRTTTQHSSPRSNETTAVLRPADNFLTVPVDLGKQVADRLTLQIVAGDLVIATRTVHVQASYLDRLTLVAMVVLVLLGLLLFIRRRVKSADVAATDAASMPSDTTLDA